MGQAPLTLHPPRLCLRAARAERAAAERARSTGADICDEEAALWSPPKKSAKAARGRAGSLHPHRVAPLQHRTVEAKAKGAALPPWLPRAAPMTAELAAFAEAMGILPRAANNMGKGGESHLRPPQA